MGVSSVSVSSVNGQVTINAQPLSAYRHHIVRRDADGDDTALTIIGAVAAVICALVLLGR